MTEHNHFVKTEQAMERSAQSELQSLMKCDKSHEAIEASLELIENIGRNRYADRSTSK